VREQRLLSWEDAVRRMSGLPASIVGLVDRGLLAVGMAADVVVFDSTTIVDHATYDDNKRAPEGVRHVVVNGRLALRDGAPAGAAAGRALYRSGNMISRPLRVDAARGVTVDASGTTIRITQAADARAARGVVRISHGGTTAQATSLGVLQVAPGWASVTGRARTGDAELPFVLVVDERDPLANGASAATLTLAGRAPVRVLLPTGSVRVR
jgi:N-acyl-D-amino-acid deacylase